MMDIKMIDLKKLYAGIQPELDNAIKSVIDSGFYINGKDVGEFCDEFANYLSVNHVLPCANGSDALWLALKALELPEGSEVIVPSFNYISAPEAIIQAGLKPVFCEVDDKTFNLDPESVKSYVKNNTAAIVVVHLYGQPAEMDAIMRIAAEHNLKVVEDNAQSIGSWVEYNGARIKTGAIGDCNTTSFFPTKPLGCIGDGGAVMTNDPETAEKVVMYSKHGQKQKYYSEFAGINSRLDTLQAAILKVRLKHFDAHNDLRISAAEKYKAFIDGIEGVEYPYISAGRNHVFHQFTLKLDEDIDRDKLKSVLADKDIPSMVYYPVPIHLQNAFTHLGYEKNSLPLTEKLCDSVISLPIHPYLDDSQIEFICECLKNAVQLAAE